MVATARGSLHVMELLLEHGGLLDICDAFGQTAESFAVLFNQKQSRRTIIQFKWKKRNEASMIREGQIKSAGSRAKSDTEQAANESDRKREERLVQLAEQRRKRQDQLALQQIRLPKKKCKRTSIRRRRTCRFR
jgi:predicted HNH restriction endonuclease